MASRSLILVAMMVLGACAVPESETAEIEDAPAKGEPTFTEAMNPEALEPTPCGSEGYQSFVGEPLAAVTYPDDLRVRVIPFGAIVTMDYSAERMNIHLDKEGVITKVICG